MNNEPDLLHASSLNSMHNNINAPKQRHILRLVVLLIQILTSKAERRSSVDNCDEDELSTFSLKN